MKRHERASDQVWIERAAALAALVTEPMSAVLLLDLAARAGWPEDLVRQTLAHAEGRTLKFEHGQWRRI